MNDWNLVGLSQPLDGFHVSVTVLPNAAEEGIGNFRCQRDSTAKSYVRY